MEEYINNIDIQTVPSQTLAFIGAVLIPMSRSLAVNVISSL